MKRIFFTISIIFCSLFLSSAKVFSQDSTQITWRDRLFFGGSLGLQFGTITSIEVAPQVGYRISSRFAAGLGFKYEYYKSAGYSYIPSYETSIYGGCVFASYVLWKNFLSEGSSLMAHAENEVLSLDRRYFGPDLSTGRFALNSFLVGGGLRQRMGRRSYSNILILWNLNQTSNSPYQNPIIRIAFQF